MARTVTTLGTSPASLGYRWPAEWETHRATWLAWPHNAQDWPGKFAPIPWAYVEFVRTLSEVETVGVIVKNPAMRDAASDMLERGGVDLERVEFVQTPTNRVWTRDSGPTFLTHPTEGLAALHWKFNAWAKYKNHQHDALLPEVLAEHLSIPRLVAMVEKNGKPRHVVLEGGGIDGNGHGVVLTTEEWLLSDVQVRNPGFTREDYEQIFADFLGCPHTIWLGNGIVGDDTHGHVDDITRFVNEQTVVTVVEPDKTDPNHSLLADNVKRLKRATDHKGRPLNVVELPMPKRPVVFEGTRLPASYANFLIANGVVLVPTFNDPHDSLALRVLGECFPKHDIIGLPCRDFVWGLGTLHCASQQEPAV